MQKPPPIYSANLVFRPQSDGEYVHFEHALAHPFVADGDALPRVNIWWLADSALLSYWNPATAPGIFARAGFETDFIKTGSTDCYLAWQDRFVIVAFRGTEPDEWDDILTDVQIELVPWRKGRVHRGFKQALDDVWPALEARLKALPGRTVWFCGHSLGGALATLAADRHPKARGVCTFGCPRVGDADFASAFNAKLRGASCRYVNHYDVVTHVPPPLFGYKHVAAGRFISANGTISNRPPNLLHYFDELFGRPQQLLDMIEAMKRGALPTAPNFLLEHMPKAYAIWTWNDYHAHG